ncbi:MAG TPA: hypothetical protein VHG70_17320 [Nocardioidaceae bacterium]|nr:hypothetical protein [Nocardioidaceae bacterium]
MNIFRNRILAVSAGAVLMVGLGAGGAVAHGKIGSDDIRHFAVQKRHLGQGSVGAWELRHAGVRSPQIGDGAVRWADLAGPVQDKMNEPGPQGAKGEKGDPGTAGADGDDGVAGLERVETTQDFSGGGYGWTDCPEGKTVIGGGYAFEEPADLENGLTVAMSAPVGQGDVFGTPPNTVEPKGPAWMIRTNKPMNVNPGEITIYALCAEVHEED